jgi:hypothetical protein
MDYSAVPFNPQQEQLVKILMKKTQNDDPVFFRLMVGYYFSKLASMMRCNVKIADSQTIPINMYGVNLAPSGSGKGHSMNILDEQVISGFQSVFLDSTFPQEAERNLAQLAINRARKYQTDDGDELKVAQAEFEDMGALLFSFDSATPAAIKQMRMKLLMARAGSMNLEIDEIGSNLLGNTDALNTFLELFDVGKIKQKLVKNTRDNIRIEDIPGITPTNMLLFGTPMKLLDGAKTEGEFNDFLEVGYARRCFFGYCRKRKSHLNQTAEDIYAIYHDQKTNDFLQSLNLQLKALADPTNFNKTLPLAKDVTLALFKYRLWCQERADELSELQEMKKAEINHRYFKTAKLAGAYAFIERSAEVKMEHLEHAIAMSEMSGAAFQNILARERNYVKVAQYLALNATELTQADLVEDLPFYRGSEAQKRELIKLASSWGYKNGVVIRTEIIDGIEFFSAKTTPKTDLDKMIFSLSTNDITTGFAYHEVPFAKMGKMFGLSTAHWVNHKLRDGYRDESHVVPGFNMVVLDVENSVSTNIAQHLLKDYEYALYTTKRHTENDHRYRIVMPLSHRLELDGADYRNFMNNLFDWLPFDVDRQTAQRSRKWLGNNGKVCYNSGELLDAFQFIPKTKKAEDIRERHNKLSDMTALERWFVSNTGQGNRNSRLVQYGYALIDDGQDILEIMKNVRALNNKLEQPLAETEIANTIEKSLNQRYYQRKTKEKPSVK